MSEAFIWGSSGFIALYFLRLNRNNFYSLALASVGLLDDILKTEDDDEKLIRVQIPLIPAGAIAILTIAVNFVVDWLLHRASGLKD